MLRHTLAPAPHPTPEVVKPNPPPKQADARSSPRKQRLPLSLMWTGGVLIFFWLLLPVLFGRDPYTQNIPDRLLPPGSAGSQGRVYVLGSDPLGRDNLGRLAYGARLSLTVGVTSVLGGGVIGFALGILSGYIGGGIDRILMRIVDLQLSFPFIILAIGLLAAVGPSINVVIMLFIVARWPVYARVARASSLELKTREFVTAARAVGATDVRLLIRHIAPSCFAPILVIASFELAGVIMAEASLGFLGVGIAPPTPTWGNLLAGSRNYLRTAWWLAVFPGLSISLVALAANLMGDYLRDYLDPRLR